jgi:hypothetical protein
VAKRTKKPATVTAAQLPEAISAKIAAATLALHELLESEKPMWTDIQDPRRRLNSCVGAARGVFLSIQTFAYESLPGKKQEFWAWVNPWEGSLSGDQRQLWDLMTDHRDAQEHGAGPDLIAVEIPLDHDPNVTVFTGGPLFPTMRPHGGSASKGGWRFAAYPDRPASKVCEDYIALMRRFEADFRRDHAALL